MSPRRLLAAILLTALAAHPAQGQEGSSAAVGEGAPATSATPAPAVVTAIPLAEVESQAVRTADKIRSIGTTLATHPEVESIEAELA